MTNKRQLWTCIEEISVVLLLPKLGYQNLILCVKSSGKRTFRLILKGKVLFIPGY